MDNIVIGSDWMDSLAFESEISSRPPIVKLGVE
jgi:hypothetical protein